MVEIKIDFSENLGYLLEEANTDGIWGNFQKKTQDIRT